MIVHARTLLSVLKRVALGVAVLAVAALAHRSFSTVPVVIDGDRVATRPGTPVGELAAECSPAAPGDLLGALDHRVVREGSGNPVILLVNGRVAEASEVVQPGDRLRTYSGTDVVEPVIVETRTVDVPPTVIGVGPVERVLATGTAGVARVTVGAVSREVVATETVTRAQPGLVRRVPAPGAKIVALTFDDGPWPGQTDAILDILDEKDVPATFFMLGLRVKARPDLARRVVDSGHAVGNHTYHHVHLTSADAKVVASEISGTNRLIAQTTGVTPTWFRAPGGFISPLVFAELKREGLRSALWTVDPQDWREGLRSYEIADGVVAATRPGSVILLHDGGGDQRETITALPWIIDLLRAKGYEFVTLDELGRVRATW
jgi:peptidoglycan/xylan/chitin deacetylase (PgdA/CDA1 family)